MSFLLETQKEVAGLCDHPYYLSAYQKDEYRYWNLVARWLWELPVQGVRNALDIGCAYGTLALFMKKRFTCDVYCTDFLDCYLGNRLTEKYNLRFQVSNIELDPFPFTVSAFDIIIFTEVLEHLNFHPQPTLTRIRDLLSEKGLLFFSTPDACVYGRGAMYEYFDAIPYPRAGMPVLDDHIYVYHEEELRELFARTGLKIVRLEKNEYGHFNAILTK